MTLSISLMNDEVLPTLSSLPRSYRIVGEEAASDVRAERGAIRLSPKGTGIYSVQDAHPERSSSPEASFVLDSMWLHNPAMTAALPLTRAALTGAAFVQFNAIVESPSRIHRGLVSAVALLLKIGDVGELHAVCLNRSSAAVSARVSGIPVTIIVASTQIDTGETAMLRVIGTDTVVTIALPDGQTARPAAVHQYLATGAEIAPQIFESAARAAARTLSDAIAEGASPGDEWERAVQILEAVGA